MFPLHPVQKGVARHSVERFRDLSSNLNRRSVTIFVDSQQRSFRHAAHERVHVVVESTVVVYDTRQRSNLTPLGRALCEDMHQRGHFTVRPKRTLHHQVRTVRQAVHRVGVGRDQRSDRSTVAVVREQRLVRRVTTKVRHQRYEHVRVRVERTPHVRRSSLTQIGQPVQHEPYRVAYLAALHRKRRRLVQFRAVHDGREVVEQIRFWRAVEEGPQRPHRVGTARWPGGAPGLYVKKGIFHWS